MTNPLHDAIDRALAAREGLIAELHAQDTDAYRLFHGVAEGRPGLTIDRYGALVLAQTFREPLSVPETAELEAHLRRRLPPFEFAYNDRAAPRQTPPLDAHEVVCKEHGVQFAIRARHRGQDPWLFLDLRAGRRRLAGLSRGKSVLNLFAYTCGAGIAAAAAGASEAWNVDFSKSALEVGRRNAELNAIDRARVRFLAEDCLPVMRQLAGMPVKGRARSREHVKLEPRVFDVVFLDPPAWSAGPFGAVDVDRDYESLFKPALLCARPGGHVLATNHSPAALLATWVGKLERCAMKAGAPIEVVDTLGPGRDFPSVDGRPPLKIALLRRA